MKAWHLTPDAPRSPRPIRQGEVVTLWIGTWPIGPDQSVWVTYQTEHFDLDRTTEEVRLEATWRYNAGSNSYWSASMGPFSRGERVTYRIGARSPGGAAAGGTAVSFRVGPKVYLALLWHQHQPVYQDVSCIGGKGSYRQPWIRLHAIRDYYSMAALVEQHPGLHLTINLTPCLLQQIEDYIEKGATDRSLELALIPAEILTGKEREEILSTFFDADWHNQIFPHPRYKELFIQRSEDRPFAAQDLRDLQMWFNLAWFGKEFRDGTVRLVTGEAVSVRRFVEQGRDFGLADLQEMVSEQYKIMRCIIPIHRKLQEQGQIEVSTTPFYHPILPLLTDTDQATIDKAGTSRPRRFCHPEDADTQVSQAVAAYRRWFGQSPRGMWPAEGAVSQSVIPLFARHGARWIASDRGVLAQSGRWGYRAEDPDVLCQPYWAEEAGHAVSIFFRESQLSDEIGFRYYQFEDPVQAAQLFLRQMRERFVRRFSEDEDRVIAIVLDGENAWGAYPEDARPFLHALYRLLERDGEIETVTFAEYLDGNFLRGITPHPPERHNKIHNLFTGSWIDENGSARGADLGTWIGEEEENKAWELLGRARTFLDAAGASPENAPGAFREVYAAEGSDWFWWLGQDHDSGNDGEFDDLFRTHLKNAYRLLEWRLRPS